MVTTSKLCENTSETRLLIFAILTRRSALTQLRCSQLWYNTQLNIFSKFTLFRGPILHLMIIIPDIPNVLIEQVDIADEITLTLRTASPTACCPSCGTISSRVQSR